jgi:inorganic triphosphatase YgiF
METELKLSLHQHDVPALLTHPLLNAPVKTLHLLNTYFDTPALDLKQQRMAVRERLANGQWLLTVKTAGHSENGLSRRQEWEALTTPGTLDFATLVDDPPLANALMSLRHQLRPLFRTDFERHSWMLAYAGARIEVALDQGHITVPGTNFSDVILELELELLSGSEAALHALADALRQTPRGTVPLSPSDASKAQRGLALFAQATRQP